MIKSIYKRVLGRFSIAAILLAALGSLTLGTAASQASAASAQGPGSCAPVKVFIPRPGFQPLHASAAQLRANGFPQRPAASDPAAVAVWTDVVEHAKHFLAPHPICSMDHRSTLYSGIWAGHQVPKGDYSNSGFVQTTTEWVQPSVAGDSHYTNYNTAPDASFWTGISGSSDLIQAGCDSIATATPTYRCWTEDYPHTLTWEGPPVDAGDTMYVEVSYLGGNYTYYYFENMSTGNAVSFTNATPLVQENNVEYIIERANGVYLPNFGSVNVSHNYFWQANNTEHELTTTNNLYIMTSNCASSGTKLADPTSVSGGAFHQVWKAKSPYDNSGC